jgi:hypothetical protein
VLDSCEKDSTQVDNNRQSQQSSFVHCMLFVHCVSAEQEVISTQIRHFSNYHVSCIILFYIIHVYGWDLEFTSIIKLYDVKLSYTQLIL